MRQQDAFRRSRGTAAKGRQKEVVVGDLLVASRSILVGTREDWGPLVDHEHWQRKRLQVVRQVVGSDDQLALRLAHCVADLVWNQWNAIGLSNELRN